MEMTVVAKRDLSSVPSRCKGQSSFLIAFDCGDLVTVEIPETRHSTIGDGDQMPSFTGA